MNRDFQINALRTKTKFKIASVRLQMKQHIFEKLKDMFDEDTLKAPLISIKEALDESLDYIRQERLKRSLEDDLDTVENIKNFTNSIERDIKDKKETTDNPSMQDCISEENSVEMKDELKKSVKKKLKSKDQEDNLVDSKNKKKKSKKIEEITGFIREDAANTADINDKTVSTSTSTNMNDKSIKVVKSKLQIEPLIKRQKVSEDPKPKDVKMENSKIVRNAANKARLSISLTHQRLNGKLSEFKKDFEKKLGKVAIKKKVKEDTSKSDKVLKSSRKAAKVNIKSIKNNEEAEIDPSDKEVFNNETVSTSNNAIDAVSKGISADRVKPKRTTKIKKLDKEITKPVKNDRENGVAIPTRQLVDIPLLMSDSNFEDNKEESELKETMSDLELPPKRFPGLKKYFYDSESSMMSYVKPKKKSTRKR